VPLARHAGAVRVWQGVGPCVAWRREDEVLDQPGVRRELHFNVVANPSTRASHLTTTISHHGCQTTGRSCRFICRAVRGRVWEPPEPPVEKMQVRVAIVGSQKYGDVEEYQSVLIMNDPMISTRTRHHKMGGWASEAYRRGRGVVHARPFGGEVALDRSGRPCGNGHCARRSEGVMGRTRQRERHRMHQPKATRRVSSRQREGGKQRV
jgi:hypothetical protein